MQLTSILMVFGLAAAVTANPLESRNSWHDAKACGWQCEKYYPKCDNDWKPKCCNNGWGDKNCYEWGDSCPKEKSYCCYEDKCYWD